MNVELALVNAAFGYVQERHPGATLGLIVLTVTPEGGCPVKVSLHPGRIINYQSHLAREEIRQCEEPPVERLRRPYLKDLVLQCLREVGRPLKASAIARRCGRKYNPHLRSVLCSMKEGVDAPLVEGDDGGYALREWTQDEVVEVKRVD